MTACSDSGDDTPAPPSGGSPGVAGAPAGSSGSPNVGGSNASGAAGASAGGVSGSGGAAAGAPTAGAMASGGSATAGAASGGSAGASGMASGGSAGASGMASGGAGAGGTGGTGGSSAGSGGTAGRGGSAGAAGAPGGSGGTGGGAYNPCPTTGGKACTILPLGDSITEGCCTMTIGGYRIELFRQAVRNGKNITFVGTQVNGPTNVEMRSFPRNHQGHGGYTINQIAAQNVTDTALSMFHPNIVLLMIGTNDINGNQDVANAPKRLGSLIDKITTSEPNALVVVASIIPIRNDGTNQRVITYNNAIKTEVSNRASAGKHVMWVDNYAVISQNPNFKTALMSDDLHPNDTGYAALGQSFYSAIAPLLPTAVQ